MPPRLLQLSALCLLTLWSSTATAAPTPSDDRLARARQLCDSGDTRAGVILYAQIYVETLQPIHVYHQARCYQRNGHDQKAIERYREYMRVSRTLPRKQRERIEARIQEMNTPAAETTAAVTPPPSPPKPPTAAPPTPAPTPTATTTPLAPPTATPPPPTATTTPRVLPRALAAAPPPRPPAARNPVPTANRPRVARATEPSLGARKNPSLQSNPSPQTSSDPSSRRRFFSLITATGAGVALGAAVTFHVAREDLVRQHNRTCYPFKVASCARLRARVDATQTGALIGYGTAAFLTGLSTYLYLSAPGDPARERLAALTCSPTATLDGISCGARF